MGKSSGGAAPPAPVVYEQPDMTPMYAAMNDSMMMMMEMQSRPPALPPPPQSTVPEIDWDKARQELKDSVANDATTEAVARRGRSYTRVTSPLAEDEESVVTGSILSGR